MTTPRPNRRWYHLTPARFFLALLVVQVFLFLSEQFQWFWFNEHKGWTVLIAVGVVGVAVLVMLLWGLVCLLLRRQFRFGVRSLLLFMVVVSIPLGWFAWEMQRARKQAEAVARITELGGSVNYDYQLDEDGQWRPEIEPSTPAWLRRVLGDDFFCEVVSAHCDGREHGDNDARQLQELANLEKVDLDYTQITDNGLARLKGMKKLEILSLAGTQITDNGLAHLHGMTKLEALALTNTQITNNGLAHLQGLTKLEELWLGSTQITDNGLAHLANMTRLERLYLDYTQITDDGLAHLEGMTQLEGLFLDHTQVTGNGLAYLAGMTKLEWLSLSETQVTDSGLPHLKRMTRLKHLSLEGTEVTYESVKKLQQALPDCDITCGSWFPL